MKQNLACRGFSIVETMVALTVLLFVLAGVSTFMRQQSNTVIGMRMVTTRDALGSRLFASATSPRALKVSTQQPQNGIFRRCVSDNRCPEKVFMGFALYDAFGSQLAGTVRDPVRYNIDGGKCSKPSSACPIEVYSEFKIVCNRTPCDTPVAVQVRYTVAQAASVKVPGNATLDTKTNTSPEVSTAMLSALANDLRCNKPGEVLKGIRASGEPECVSTVRELGFETVEGLADKHENPNRAGGIRCGWASTPPMQHVIGTVCCPSGKIPMGGGGTCNHVSGGFLESSRPESGNCWFVDCCKYSPYPPSPIHVQCINRPN